MKKPYSIEWRIISGPWIMKWRTCRRYKTEKRRDQALAVLQAKDSHWSEYRKGEHDLLP